MSSLNSGLCQIEVSLPDHDCLRAFPVPDPSIKVPDSKRGVAVLDAYDLPQGALAALRHQLQDAAECLKSVELSAKLRRITEEGRVLVLINGNIDVEVSSTLEQPGEEGEGMARTGLLGQVIVLAEACIGHLSSDVIRQTRDQIMFMESFRGLAHCTPREICHVPFRARGNLHASFSYLYQKKRADWLYPKVGYSGRRRNNAAHHRYQAGKIGRKTR